ncbi:LysM peptidoglycan-binding domain-containing M23 family metallopeptidase [Streptomyces sp. NPDC047315]|uniref:M23 family metallopeptidase n=1 Tax=Streptomyces sp. NPDC047315 TaxID=3155142 RepID=UPI00340B824E
MSAQGKHRRPKSTAFTRGFVAAGTGGAAIALPLMGATGAHAAEQAAPAAPVVAPVSAASAPAAEKAAAASTTYVVVIGDHLSKIADEHRLDGGWQQLYQDNRDAVGENPSLIHPGLKLTIGAKADGKGAAKAEKPAESKAEKPAEKPAEKKTEGDKVEKKVESKAVPAAPAAQKPAGGNDEPATSAPAESSSSGSSAGTSSGWAAPLANAQVSTSYRASGAAWSSGYHTGVDFAAPTGTGVRAIGPGSVVSAGYNGAYGNEVVIKHTDGTYSQYAHLSSLSVSAGQSVTGGQSIGQVGSTGNSSGPHLHLEVRTGPSYGSDIDPVAHLRSHGVSL